MQQKISVITIVYNDYENIERTLKSVISQNFKLEYVVIDGGSSDGTVNIIKKYEHYIDVFVSEPDKGIYDAMNKGIQKATGEWIIFMNSGDVFYDNTVIHDIFSKELPDNVSFIYSNFYAQSRLNIASFEDGILLHQSVFYKRQKHSEYGFYAVTKKYIISDYLFFLRFNIEEVYKTDIVISRNSAAGVSSGKWCVLQKLCSDFIYNKISFPKLIIKLCYWNTFFPILYRYKNRG